MKLSIVLSTDPAEFEAVAFKGNFQANLAYIAEIGYDGVELAVRDPTQIDLDRILKELDRYQLRVPAIGTGQAYGEENLSITDENSEVRSAAIERITHHIELAHQLASVVIIGLIRGVAPSETDWERYYKRLVDSLRICAEVASRKSVKLVLEPINRYETNLINTIEEGLDLIEQVGAPDEVLGLLPDTFHMNIEEPSIKASITNAANYIYHFHVADSNRWYPGAGHLDFRAVLSTLRGDLKYQGWVSAEIMPKPNANVAAKKAYAHLQSCLHELVENNLK